MNPEMQILVERLELLEARMRGARWTAFVAMIVAIAACAILLMRGAEPPTPDRGRYSVIEANRFLLRDLDGVVAGGMEVDRSGTIKLVLGRGATESAVFLEAQRNGVAHLTLKGPGGDVRAALLGTATPSLALSSRPGASGVVLLTREGGAGQVVVSDTQGRVRFRAP